MDRLMELTEYMVKRLRTMPDKYYLIMEPECVNVSFWYIPRRLRGIIHDAKREAELGKVNNHRNFHTETTLVQLNYSKILF